MSNRLFDNLKFNDFTLSERQDVVTSIDTTGSYIIKIEVFNNSKKSRDIEGEYEIMRHLNERGSQTCPKVYEFGEIQKTDLPSLDLLVNTGQARYRYIIQEFVVSMGNYNLSDVLLTLIEQKKLGVYQGDVKPKNIRFNPKTGVCVFIDYDQAEFLDDRVASMSNSEFLRYCDDHDRARYGFGNWLRHFPNINNEYASTFFVNDSLNLGYASVFKLQRTTNTTTGIYHTIKSKDVFIEGARSVDKRAEILDQVSFENSERVLDVGCNAGLLSEYLHDRGCRVTGVDNDPHIVVAAKIIANILGKNINYAHVDLDNVQELGSFDTIMLFSVFHHTRNPIENAKKIVNSCKRIIIETRLVENGKQPTNDQWIDTTNWKFQSLQELVAYLENTFLGFKFTRNLGFADKNRYILELIKQ